MYVIFLQSTHWIKKTLTVSCTLLCESGDRVKFDKSSFSADLHAVMLRHHCSEYGRCPEIGATEKVPLPDVTGRGQPCLLI